MEDIKISSSEVFTNVIAPTVKFRKVENGTLIIYLNKPATALIIGTDRVKIQVSRNYIVFFPDNSSCSRPIHYYGKEGTTSSKIYCSPLASIVEDGAVFEAFSYCGGIAIKRNQPINKEHEYKE